MSSPCTLLVFQKSKLNASEAKPLIDNNHDPDAVAAAIFVQILLEEASHHYLSNEWRKLKCLARRKVHEELARITPYLCKRVCKWCEAADWHRFRMAVRFLGRDIV